MLWSELVAEVIEEGDRRIRHIDEQKLGRFISFLMALNIAKYETNDWPNWVGFLDRMRK